MDDNKTGGYDDVLALDTVDNTAPDSPTGENNQNNIQKETPTEDFPTAEALEPSAEPKKSEPVKSESDPDEKLLKTVEELKSDIPLGKIERVQQLIRQKNEWKQKYEEALKTTATPVQTSETATKPTTQDISKYSDDFEEMLTQIGEPEFGQLFEYVNDENGKPIAFKDPSKEPHTIEETLKIIYPVIEKNILKRAGLMAEIRSQKQEALRSAEENSTTQLKQEIQDSFVDDKEGYDNYTKTLEDDYAEFKAQNPNRPFDVKAHHALYMKHIYSKAPAINPNNLSTAKKVSRSSVKADATPRDAGSISMDDIVNL